MATPVEMVCSHSLDSIDNNPGTRSQRHAQFGIDVQEGIKGGQEGFMAEAFIEFGHNLNRRERNGFLELHMRFKKHC